MFKVGDAIKWMCPLDNDYTYGEITALRKSVATVKGTGLYSGITAEVHLSVDQHIIICHFQKNK